MAFSTPATRRIHNVPEPVPAPVFVPKPSAVPAEQPVPVKHDVHN